MYFWIMKFLLKSQFNLKNKNKSELIDADTMETSENKISTQ